MTGRDIIAMGGSAGSVAVIRQICREFPPDLTASVLVTVHIGSDSPNLLADILDKAGPLSARTAIDGETLKTGHIHVAPAGHHLMVEGQVVQLGRGPRENLARPAIDPLFRSVGLGAGPRAIGVLLSGMLHDGASGLADLKSCGGLTVVQDPNDAVESEMPWTALQTSDIDYRAPAIDLAALLTRLVQERPGPTPVPPARIAIEVAIARGRPSDTPTISQVADTVPLNCPACSGTLSQMRDAPLRFRCQVGHAYSARALAEQQVGSVDEALRIALRVIGERAVLMEKMAQDARTAGRTSSGASFAAQAQEYRRSSEVLMGAVLRK